MASGRQVAQSEIQNFEEMTMQVDYPKSNFSRAFISSTIFAKPTGSNQRTPGFRNGWVFNSKILGITDYWLDE